MTLWDQAVRKVMQRYHVQFEVLVLNMVQKFLGHIPPLSEIQERSEVVIHVAENVQTFKMDGTPLFSCHHSPVTKVDDETTIIHFDWNFKELI